MKRGETVTLEDGRLLRWRQTNGGFLVHLVAADKKIHKINDLMTRVDGLTFDSEQ